MIVSHPQLCDITIKLFLDNALAAFGAEIVI